MAMTGKILWAGGEWMEHITLINRWIVLFIGDQYIPLDIEQNPELWLYKIIYIRGQQSFGLIRPCSELTKIISS